MTLNQHEIEKRKIKLRNALSKYIFLVAIYAIPIAGFAVFWVYVNIQSILNAFRLEVQGELQWSFRNWQYFWQDLTGESTFVNMPQILRNTLIFFGTNIAIILPLSFLFSYFLFKKVCGYKFFRVIFFAPNIISAAVLATLFKFMVNPSLDGIITQLYTLITNKPSPNFLMDERYALTAVVYYCIWTGFSVNLVLFNGAMERVPKDVLEAASIDGIGNTRELFQIVLPMIWSTIGTLIITTTAGIFMASGPLLLLTQGAYGTNTISFWIYQQVQAQTSPYYPATVGFIFTLIGVPIVLAVKWLVERFFTEVQY